MKPLTLRASLPQGPQALAATVLGLGLLLAGLRAWAMLGPVAWRPLFLLHCVVMAALPWVLLDGAGRAACGLKRPRTWRVLGPAAALGALAALSGMALGWALFANGPDHWFVSVANSFKAQPTPGFALWQLHLMFTLPGMLFSPVGEEIFFRGLMQRTLENHWSSRAATAVEAVWFGAVHLIHHGIVLSAMGWSFRPLSGLLWFGLMVAVSLLFAALRRHGDSVLPAVVAHSAHNLAMNVCIFAWLW